MLQFHVVGLSGAEQECEAQVRFESSCGQRFAVPIPAAQSDAVLESLDRPSHLQALESWLFADLFDADLTEVLIEEYPDCRRFSLVLSAQGILKRIPVASLDGILTGLKLGAPFLVATHPRPALRFL